MNSAVNIVKLGYVCKISKWQNLTPGRTIYSMSKSICSLILDMLTSYLGHLGASPQRRL